MPAPTHDISNTLRRDLSLVLPEQWLNGTPRDDAPALPTVTEAASRLGAAKAPAIVGLAGLTIEATREAVFLLERLRGRILPSPAARLAGSEHIAQTASLGHVFASDLIVWVGCHGDTNAITRRVAERQLRAAFVRDELAPIFALREAARDPRQALFDGHGKVAAVLGPDTDARVASQWHKFAADVQTRVRVAVIRLPDLATHANTRGASEATTWLTGLACGPNGIDFADGAPRPCAADAITACDLILDATLDGLPASELPGAGVIRIGSRMRPPLAARVMRFDGITLWLADAPEKATADPLAAWLRDVASSIRRPA